MRPFLAPIIRPFSAATLRMSSVVVFVFPFTEITHTEPESQKMADRIMRLTRINAGLLLIFPIVNGIPMRWTIRGMHLDLLARGLISLYRASVVKKWILSSAREIPQIGNPDDTHRFTRRSGFFPLTSTRTYPTIYPINFLRVKTSAPNRKLVENWNGPDGTRGRFERSTL